MKKWVCDICGYVYDEAVGDPDKRTDSLKFTKKELSKQTDKLAKKSKA